MYVSCFLLKLHFSDLQNDHHQHKIIAFFMHLNYDIINQHHLIFFLNRLVNTTDYRTRHSNVSNVLYALI